MKYACIVYADPALFGRLSPDARRAFDAESLAADVELEERGALILAEALGGRGEAVTIQVRDGRMSATNGPFAETSEQLAGFVVLEARDLNEALLLAGTIPLARLGTVEVRPVMQIEPTGQAGEAGPRR